MKLPIFTERLMLRKLTNEDLDNIFLLDSNPEVMKYVGVPPTTEKGESARMLENIINQYQNNGTGRLAVIEKESNQFISEALAGGNVLGDQEGEWLDHPVFDQLIFNVVVVNLLELFILVSRRILRHIADGFDKLRLDGISQRKPVNNICKIFISDITGARNIHDEFESVFGIK